MHVEFFEDPKEFLARAGDYLHAHVRDCSVIASQTGKSPIGDEPYWFAAICDNEIVLNVAMRTHPHAPHAMFLPQMSEYQITVLATALKSREEDVTAAAGNLAACTALLTEMGLNPTVRFHSRLLFLEEVEWPKEPEGKLRQATMEDFDLIVAWVKHFVIDSEVDGGREATEEMLVGFTNGSSREKELRRVIEAGKYWFWEVDGTPVHMTGATPVGFGLGHIGPVFTPREHRGHGYASWVVAKLSQDFLDRGLTPRLYTDQANPISNKVYQRIGYVAYADEGEVKG